jgi:hypothetical protein
MDRYAGERNYNHEEQLREGRQNWCPSAAGACRGSCQRRAFWFSEDASYIVGSCLRIDGGFVLVH